jgi:hypothetical protein
MRAPRIRPHIHDRKLDMRCRYPGCKNRSKGPRNHFLCEEHLNETAPGEEAQVDYGAGPMVRDPSSGKYRRTRLFVLTLGHSRKSVRLLTFQSARRSGRSCTRRLSAGWAARRA